MIQQFETTLKIDSICTTGSEYNFHAINTNCDDPFVDKVVIKWSAMFRFQQSRFEIAFNDIKDVIFDIQTNEDYACDSFFNRNVPELLGGLEEISTSNKEWEIKLSPDFDEEEFIKIGEPTLCEIDFTDKTCFIS